MTVVSSVAYHAQLIATRQFPVNPVQEGVMNLGLGTSAGIGE